MSGQADQHGLTIRPAPSAWRPAPSPVRSPTREHLGLPAGVPIVMSGHQAEFWHPGILAKHAALTAFASRAGAHAAWLVVDQDANQPWRIRYPAAGPARGVWNVPVGSGVEVRPQTPTAFVPTLRPGDAAGVLARVSPSHPWAGEGLGRLAAALRAHEGLPNAAAQITAAMTDACAGVITPARPVFATSLSGWVVFGEALAAIAADPRGCAEHYNRAVAAHPEAGVRPLWIGPGRVELPLWALEPGRPRRPVFAHELGALDPPRLAPRALLMTGLVRRAACDLFIHGLGGERYDRATEAWLASWMSWTGLAPTVVVSATLTLPFTEAIPEPEEIARAAWTAHRARHDPAIVRDPHAAREKSAALARVRAARGRSQRRSAYDDLQRMLAAYRAAHGAEIEGLRARARGLSGQGPAASVVHDRTWPAPLYPVPALRALVGAVAGAFSA